MFTTILLIDKTHPLSKTRFVLASIISPIQYTVDFPINLIGSLIATATNTGAITQENAKLQAENLLLKADLQKLIVTEKENSQLRDLLQSTHKLPSKMSIAQLLAVDTSDELHQIVINKGSKDGAFKGQAVLDANGIIGQIVSFGFNTSHVLLLTDSTSAIPVRNVRTGERAIAVGSGRLNEMELIHTFKPSNIQEGDKYMTSGLGQRYPAGFPVANVVSILNEDNKIYSNVTLKTSAKMNKTRLVLLVWKDTVT